MKLFNIGIPELLFLLIIMLIFLGPTGMQSNARKLALFIRKIVRSKTWQSFLGIYKEVKEYPNELMKEVELEELQKELNKEITEIHTSTEAELTQAGNEIEEAMKEQKTEVQQIDAELNKTQKELQQTDLNALDDPEGSDHE